MTDSQSARADDPLLRIESLHKSYGAGHPVLQGVDFETHAGERIVVIGPSGGGKSTLLRVIMGLEDIDEGLITFKGRNYVSAANGRTRIDAGIRRSIGMVFQHYTLFPHLNVMRNLVLAPCKVNHEDRASATKRGLALLERFGLTEKAGAYPSQLSGGQKQRVAIVRALMMDPALMLFDEVTSALDPELVAEVEQVILQLTRQDLPMVIVTHDIWFAKRIASRVLFCDGGKIVEDGPPEQVLNNPKTERARDFVTRVYHANG
jgi:polar amino acid transport system ATP-binding protein